MKLTIKILFAAVGVGMCVALVFFFLKSSSRRQISQVPVTQPISEKSEIVSVPPSAPKNTAQIEHTPIVTNNVVTRPYVQKALPVSAVPTEISYKPRASIVRNEELLQVLSTVSNAVLSVDQILKSKSYKMHEFSRTVWLTAEDKERFMEWRIFPYKTNAVVGSVEATAYLDEALTQKDPSRSFLMSFYPETQSLRSFFWRDSHETLMVASNGTTDYARKLGGDFGLRMRWDDEGNLVSSNVYNWVKRGRVIGHSQERKKPLYRLGPTSAVEAATESWRRQQ